MEILRVKDQKGKWVAIPAIKGDKGEDGASTWSEVDSKPFDDIDGATIISVNGVLKVNTTNDALEDNTKPITSGGVYTIVGNIEVLLGSI